MRKPFSSRRHRLHATLASAFVLTMALGVTCARAQNAQEDDEWLDTKIFRGVLKEFGLQRDDGPIEYRERAPLVVPPSRNLPAPRSEIPATTNPAWPNDPDIKQRQREATATASQKARLKGDRAMEAMRPLRPDELERGRSAPGAVGTNSNGDTVGNQVRPSELGYTGGIWDSFTSAFRPEKVESVPFPGEAPRTALTAPPTGYQTPSPAQPYGIAPESSSKPQKPEDRLLPTR